MDVERVDGDLVALADRTEHVLLRDLAVVEEKLGRARRANSELVLLLANLESDEFPLDDERGDAAMAG